MSPPAGDATAFRLLLRLFVRRLIDSDVISPHADRHESLAVAYALVISLAVFATFFLSTAYLAAFVQLPGPAALSALSDRFLFVAASIAMSALAALVVWDALALEARDAAILGPLPIPSRTITRAKLAAVMLFGAALTIALNVVPSVLYPAFLTLNMRGARGSTILTLMAAHGVTVTMAGLFGFFAVLAIRGLCRLLLGEQLFRSVSSSVQSALVVSAITALLLAPTVRAVDVRNWVGDAAASRWPARPALWYLGLNETLAGHLIADTPIVMPPRFSLASFPKQAVEEDQAARATYRGLRPEFGVLAPRAWLSFVLATTLALTTFLWINRRLPDRSAAVPTPSPLRTRLRRLAERFTRKDPEAQAGFFFAVQTLTRSAPHRTIIATAVALGLTHALIVLAQGGARAAAIGSTPRGMLAIAIMLMLTLVAGIRYAATVPAAPAANWAIRMAWLGDERRYLAGVIRAATVLAAALVALLLPLQIALFGVVIAIAHSLLALLFAAIALDGLFLSCWKLPFVSGYVPVENPKIAWPASAAGLLIVAYGFASAERWALQTPMRTIALAMALGTIVLLVRALDSARRRERRPINLDDRPAPATQRLGLLEHIAGHE